MKAGILSDTHDQIETAREAILRLRAAGADCFFHCGDITSPEVLDLFKGTETYLVQGNNDHDVRRLEKRAAALDLAWLGYGGIVGAGGRWIAVTHGHLPKMRRTLLSAKPDFLLTGHSHKAGIRKEAGVIIINPGALYRAMTHGADIGLRRNRTRSKEPSAKPRSCALLDLETKRVRFIEIDSL